MSSWTDFASALMVSIVHELAAVRLQRQTRNAVRRQTRHHHDGVQSEILADLQEREKNGAL